MRRKLKRVQGTAQEGVILTDAVPDDRALMALVLESGFGKQRSSISPRILQLMFGLRLPPIL